MPNPWFILITVLAIVGAAIGGSLHGAEAERVTWVARIETERAEAAEIARKEEHDKQEKVNESLRKQNEALAGIAGRLERDVDKLRQRPERPTNVPDTPRVGCEGANGAELGGSHAVFLARYAAQSARFDAALTACYAAIDTR